VLRLFALACCLCLTAVPAATGARTAAPVNAAPPTVSGTAREGSTLTASSGSWGGTTPISYAYRWQRCNSSGASCGGISGATSPTYRLAAGDVGHTIRVRVTATNSDGSAQAFSSPTGVVAAAGAAPAPTSQPTPRGSPIEGNTLTASNGSWSGTRPSSFKYQWQRCTTSCSDIPGATARTYKLVADDVGKRMRYQLVALSSAGSGSIYSNQSGIVASKGTPPVNQTAPVIIGNATVGQQLTVSTGVWTGADPGGFTYAWDRCAATCTAIPGAVASSYVVQQADAAQGLRARVTAKNAVGKTTATSQTVRVAAAGGTPTSSVAVTSLAAHPDHLLIDNVKFSPSRMRTPGGVFTMRVHVLLEGTTKSVSGALVKVVGIPYEWVVQAPEVPTAADGWATLQIKTTSRLPHRGALVMQVRARAPGNSADVILGGISTRRLVQITLG